MIELIEIWSDGSCSGNPGAGGFAALIIAGEKQLAVVGRSEYTTNNRMELEGFLSGLKQATSAYPNSSIVIYTDSKYIENAINCKWLNKWVINNYKDIKNQDLWAQVHQLVTSIDVKVVWVKGHSDDKYNTIVDNFAVRARDGYWGDYAVFDL